MTLGTNNFLVSLSLTVFTFGEPDGIWSQTTYCKVFQIHDVEKDLTTVGFEPTPFRTGYGKESLIPAP